MQQHTLKMVTNLKNEILPDAKIYKRCAYEPYACSQNALDQYDYCQRHILTDKSAPFKPCSYVYASGKRCFSAAYKSNKKDGSLCNEHALKAHLLRAKHGIPTQPPESAESLLYSLRHYLSTLPKTATTPKLPDNGPASTDDADYKATKSLDPFVDIQAADVISSYSRILDAGSESESDVEPTTFANVWHDDHANSSDDESIDSENEDFLKYANAYTAEEVITMTRDKMVRLHSLYLDQYNHLYHILREKRRVYLSSLKSEKELCCSIANQARDMPEEQRMVKKLKAYKQYHKHHGAEAILRKRLNDMRLKISEGAPTKAATNQNKCTFSESGIKCTDKALPIARLCRKHILMDPNQVLFRACGRKQGEIECVTPVECIFDDQTCFLHRDIPELRIYSSPKKECDFGENVKTEERCDSLIATQDENHSGVHENSFVDVENCAQPYMDAPDQFEYLENAFKKQKMNNTAASPQDAGMIDFPHGQARVE